MESGIAREMVGRNILAQTEPGKTLRIDLTQFD